MNRLRAATGVKMSAVNPTATGTMISMGVILPMLDDTNHPLSDPTSSTTAGIAIPHNQFD